MKQLSEKESRIVALAVCGLRNRDIAQEIGTSTQVVKNCMKDIYNKLGVDGRVRLVLRYYAQPIHDYRVSLGLPV